MKSKTQRSQRAGGAVGPIGLKVSDANVRLCLRRLGDSCNGISQRLVAYSATAVCDNNKTDALNTSISAADSSSTKRSSSMRGECDALSYQLFSASLIVFESVGDISNAAMVRCNLSSLLRSRATWEMAQNKARKAGKESFQICYDNSLKYLMEALKHCDQAILSFDGSNSHSGAKRKNILIPKGNIRDNVALETAQTCLNIGNSVYEMLRQMRA